MSSGSASYSVSATNYGRNPADSYFILSAPDVVNGNLSVTGNLAVAGSSALMGAVTMGETLAVAGAATVGSLTTAGAVSAATLAASGTLTVGGAVTAAGAVSAASLSTPGTLGVGGVATFTAGGGIVVNQLATVGALQCNGAAAVTGALSASTVSATATNGSGLVRGADGYYSFTGAIPFPASAAQIPLITITTPCYFDLFICCPTVGGTLPANNYVDIRYGNSGICYWSAPGQLTTQIDTPAGGYSGGLTIGVANQGTATNTVQASNAVAGTPAFNAYIILRVMKAPDTAPVATGVVAINSPLVI